MKSSIVLVTLIPHFFRKVSPDISKDVSQYTGGVILMLSEIDGRLYCFLKYVRICVVSSFQSSVIKDNDISLDKSFLCPLIV